MIQRVQSLYLLAAVIICMILLFVPLALVKVTAAGQESIFKSYLYYGLDMSTNAHLGGKLFVLRTFYIVLIMILSLAAVFMYRKRLVQLKLIRFSIFVDILAVVTIFMIGDKDFASRFPGSQVQTSYLFPSILPLIVIILLFLAHRGVKKDEELVRSADRLR
jgi:hypothetical protein